MDECDFSNTLLTSPMCRHILPAVAEVYKGTEIVISTIQTPDRSWTARAEYQVSDKQSVKVEAPQRNYATEAEARQAALQAAVEGIDRTRVTTGKP
jgi:hypothetical protein